VAVGIWIGRPKRLFWHTGWGSFTGCPRGPAHWRRPATTAATTSGFISSPSRSAGWHGFAGGRGGGGEHRNAGSDWTHHATEAPTIDDVRRVSLRRLETINNGVCENLCCPLFAARPRSWRPASDGGDDAPESHRNGKRPMMIEDRCVGKSLALNTGYATGWPARRAPGLGPRPRRGHRGPALQRGSLRVRCHPCLVRRDTIPAGCQGLGGRCRWA